MKLAALLALLVLALPAAAAEFRSLPLAPQTIYQQGVPQVDRDGRIRRDYDPAKAFLPIGIAHALQGAFFGRDYDLALYAEAGFNTVVPFQLLDFDAVVARAAELGLKVSLPEATPERAARFRGNRTVLGFEVDHEPSVQLPDETSGERLARFLATRAAIRAIDPARLVYTVNSPSISAPRTELWRAWSRAADIHAHWKYPFMHPPVTTFTGPRGLPETIALAVRENREEKPVWWYAQAFASPMERWFFASPARLRGMLYTALVHGAAGVFWFAYDSPVTRNGRVIGIAPDTQAGPGIRLPYDPAGAPPLAATSEEVAASRALWGTVRLLNRELAALAPALLSPTADLPYTVAVAGEAATPTPVRTLLKRMPAGGLLLIAVNVEDRPLQLRIDFAGRGLALARLFDEPLAPEPRRGRWTDTIAPFGVRLYRLELP